MAAKRIYLDSFDLKPGRVLARKYEVISQLGAGWEGEVFLIRELAFQEIPYFLSILSNFLINYHN